jgi:hypothetical protein
MVSVPAQPVTLSNGTSVASDSLFKRMYFRDFSGVNPAVLELVLKLPQRLSQRAAIGDGV